LTGGYDRVVNIADVRERPLGANAFKFRLKKEVKDLESGQWHPFSETNFAITTESGIVLGYDTRNPSAPLFELKAHEKACSSLSFSPHIPNMMATCSVDEYVKIWDISNNGGTEPKLSGYKKMSTMGELFTVSFYKDIPWVLAAGGSKGEVAVWDTEESEGISKTFGGSIDKSTLVETPIEEEEEEDEEQESSDDENKKSKK
jgi:periodic tryptophan protein 1